jgi:hypothetical protein
MSSPDPRGSSNIAKQLEKLKSEILARWRDEVHRDAEQAAQIHQLDDQELQDHLPALTDKIIRLLHGEPTENLEEDAAQHGRQRRALGFSVVPLLRELQIFRRVLIDLISQIVGTEVKTEDLERARDLIIDTVDRSMNISISQYTLAAEEERISAQGEARELHEHRYPR